MAVFSTHKIAPMRVVIVIASAGAAVLLFVYLVYTCLSPQTLTFTKTATVTVGLAMAATITTLGVASYTGELGEHESTNLAVAIVCWVASVAILAIQGPLWFDLTRKTSNVVFLSRLTVLATAIVCFGIKTFTEDLDTNTGLLAVILFMMVGCLVLLPSVLAIMTDNIKDTVMAIKVETRDLTREFRVDNDEVDGNSEKLQLMREFVYPDQPEHVNRIQKAYYWCRLCAMVYDDPPFRFLGVFAICGGPERVAEELRRGFENIGVSNEYLYCAANKKQKEPSQGRFAIGCQYGNDSLVARMCIVLRGTKTKEDVMTDLTAQAVPFCDKHVQQIFRDWGVSDPDEKLFRTLYCVKGFRNRALSVAEEVKVMLRKKNLRVAQDAKFIISGHSLGGAAATLLGLFFAKTAETGSVMVYTYGQPRTMGMPKGGLTFKQALENFDKTVQGQFNNLQMVRIANKSDPVPKVPPQIPSRSRDYFWHYSSVYVELHRERIVEPDAVNSRVDATLRKAILPAENSEEQLTIVDIMNMLDGLVNTEQHSIGSSEISQKNAEPESYGARIMLLLTHNNEGRNVTENPSWIEQFAEGGAHPLSSGRARRGHRSVI